ncbi:hypothetical protein ACFWJT_26865 [Streptomyces sp. NPDC127069]|uniref:hypothetical protein n=1 Tax=Streptomyces sp. NPDC127069 TaxID=3347128 RepID=UPI0036526DB4
MPPRGGDPREPLVRHSDLGALALLAQLPAETVRHDPDVAAIARLAADPPLGGTVSKG